jgi:uncharacterized damage-inducible protein DinB
MTTAPYSDLIGYKQWADRELYEVVVHSLNRLSAQDATILLRVLDHIYVVDRVFQHHLQGLTHAFHAPRSDVLPDIRKLNAENREVDAWYVSYVNSLSAHEIAEPLNFVFTSGKPARMTRGEIILHVCMHGTYHRGNAGIVLQKSGIAPNDDRLTDFLETAA